MTEETRLPAETREPDKDARTWAMLVHLSSLIGLIVPIPFANIIAPLILYMIKKDDFPFVDDQGKESLNFQITVTLLVLLCIPLILLCIGIPLVILISLAWLILVIIASVQANDGKSYRYPLTLRLIK